MWDSEKNLITWTVSESQVVSVGVVAGLYCITSGLIPVNENN